MKLLLSVLVALALCSSAMAEPKKHGKHKHNGLCHQTVRVVKVPVKAAVKVLW